MAGSTGFENAIGGAASLELLLAGGSAAGKTTWLQATLQAVGAAGKMGGWPGLDFPFPLSEQTTHEAAWNAFTRGAPPPPTPRSGHPLQVTLRDGRRRKSRLTAHDPSGLHFEGPDLAANLPAALLRCHAIWLFIDPWSVPKFSRAPHQDNADVPPDPQAVREAPQHIFARLTNALRDLRPTRWRDLPLAVILTKTDLSPVACTLRMGTPPPALDPRALEEWESAQVRAWFVSMEEAHFVQNLEEDFSAVRYFSGRALEASATPALLAPLRWSYGRRRRALGRRRARRTALACLAALAALFTWHEWGQPAIHSLAARWEDYERARAEQLVRKSQTEAAKEARRLAVANATPKPRLQPRPPTPPQTPPDPSTPFPSSYLPPAIAARAENRPPALPAIAFVQRHFDAALRGNANLIADYAYDVEYQWGRGGHASPSEILEDKQRLYNRWPQRTWIIRSGVSTGPVQGRPESIRAVFDWEWNYVNPTRTAHHGGPLRSAGLARAILELQARDGRWEITAEHEAILRWFIKP